MPLGKDDLQVNRMHQSAIHAQDTLYMCVCTAVILPLAQQGLSRKQSSYLVREDKPALGQPKGIMALPVHSLRAYGWSVHVHISAYMLRYGVHMNTAQSRLIYFHFRYTGPKIFSPVCSSPKCQAKAKIKKQAGFPVSLIMPSRLTTSLNYAGCVITSSIVFSFLY